MLLFSLSELQQWQNLLFDEYKDILFIIINNKVNTLTKMNVSPEMSILWQRRLRIKIIILIIICIKAAIDLETYFPHAYAAKNRPIKA